MGSDVVFSSLYLDRWLRSGWYLDIVMLLLLGVASLRCRSDSVVFGLPGSWVWRWLTWCHLIFLTYRTSGATLRHIPFHLEVYGSSQICMFIITYWMLTETWTWSLPYGASWDPPSQVRTSRHLDVIVPLHLGGTFWICVHDLVMDSDNHSYMFDDKWFHDTCSFDLSHIRRHTGTYFRFRWDIRIFMEVIGAWWMISWHLFFGPVAHLMPYWGIFSVSDEIYGSSLMSHDRG